MVNQKVRTGGERRSNTRKTRTAIQFNHKYNCMLTD